MIEKNYKKSLAVFYGICYTHAVLTKTIRNERKKMKTYVLLENDKLAYVRSCETTVNSSKSRALLTCEIADLPRLRKILRCGGKINTYKYTLKFDKGWLTIKYTWNKALYKKVWIDNLRNLIKVLSNAMGKKESPVKSWLKKWVFWKGGCHGVKIA